MPLTIRQAAGNLGLSPSEYKELLNDAEKYGVIAPRKDGVLEETWEGVQHGALTAVKGLGSTMDEAGFGDGLYEYMKGIEERNQDLLPDPTYKPTNFDLAHMGRTVGTGIGQSGTSLAAGVATTAMTGGNAFAGGTVITGMVFAQTYGDEVKEFREAMPKQSEDTIKGLAFVSAMGQGLIESVLGPEAIASGVAKKIVTGAVKDTVKQYGKKRVLQILKTVGTKAVKGGLGEGSEEVFQGIISNVAKRAGGVDVPIITFDEAVEQFAGGALPGAVMSGMGGAVESISQGKANENKNDVPVEGNPAIKLEQNADAPNISKNKTSEIEAMEAIETEAVQNRQHEILKKHWELSDDLPVGELGKTVKEFTEDVSIDNNSFTLVKPKSRLTKAMAEVSKELTGQEPIYFLPKSSNADAVNGFTGKSNRLFINVNAMGKKPAVTTGHEFGHFLNRTDNATYKDFQQVIVDNLKKNHKEYLQEKISLYDQAGKKLTTGQAMDEFTNDVLGDFFADDKFWKEVFVSKQDSGRLQKIAKAVVRFVDTVAGKLKGINGTDKYLSNLKKVRSEAVKIVANRLDKKSELGQDPVLEKSNKKPVNKGIAADEVRKSQKAKKSAFPNKPSLGKYVPYKSDVKIVAEMAHDSHRDRIEMLQRLNDEAGSPYNYKELDNTAEDRITDVRMWLQKLIAQKDAEPISLPGSPKREKESSGVKFNHAEVVKLPDPKGKNIEDKLKKTKKLVRDTVLALAKKAPDKTKTFETLKATMGKKYTQATPTEQFRIKRKAMAQTETVRIEFANGKGYTLINDKGVLQNFAKKVGKMQTSLSAKITEQTSDKSVRTQLPKVKNKGSINQSEIEKTANNFIDKYNIKKAFTDIMYDTKKKRIVATDGKIMFIASQPKGNKWTLKQTKDMPEIDNIIPDAPRKITTFDTAKALHETELVNAILDDDRPVNLFLDENGDIALNVKDNEHGSYKSSDIPDGAKSLGTIHYKQLNKAVKSFKSLGIDKVKLLIHDTQNGTPLFVFEAPSIKILLGSTHGHLPGQDVDFSINPEWARRRQVNPFTTPEVKQAHDDILDNYAPEARSYVAVDMEADKIIAKHGVEKLVKEFVDGKRKADSDTNVRLARRLGDSEEFGRMKRNGNSLTIPFLKKYAEHGTEIARALRARQVAKTGDVHNDIQTAMVKFFNAFSKRYKKATDKGKAIQKEIEIQNKIYEKLKKHSIDIFHLTKKQTSDKRLMAKVLRTMQAEKATSGDKLYEFWISSILSGIKTQSRNITGNLGMLSVELAPQRLAEAIINTVVKNPKGATFSEFRDMWRAVGKSYKKATKNFTEAWDTELPTTDDMTKVENMHGVAIAGTKGRIIRIPLRFLLAADEFAKTISGQVEATAMAHREAKAKGLKGKAMQSYIEQAIADKNSSAHKWGKDRADYLAFQEKPTDSGADEIVKGLQWVKKRNTFWGYVTRYIFPFTGAPWNIVKSGIRKTPLGSINPFGWYDLVNWKNESWRRKIYTPFRRTGVSLDNRNAFLRMDGWR